MSLYCPSLPYLLVLAQFKQKIEEYLVRIQCCLLKPKTSIRSVKIIPMVAGREDTMIMA